VHAVADHDQRHAEQQRPDAAQNLKHRGTPSTGGARAGVRQCHAIPIPRHGSMHVRRRAPRGACPAARRPRRAKSAPDPRRPRSLRAGSLRLAHSA
jgi:hypothetical protein